MYTKSEPVVLINVESFKMQASFLQDNAASHNNHLPVLRSYWSFKTSYWEFQNELLEFQIELLEFQKRVIEILNRVMGVSNKVIGISNRVIALSNWVVIEDIVEGSISQFEFSRSERRRTKGAT